MADEGSSPRGLPTPMFALLSDPRPSSAVVSPRRLLGVQLAISVVMMLWLLWRWPTTAHPGAGLVGVILLFVLAAFQRLLAERVSAASARGAEAACCAAACALTVGLHGGVGSAFGVPFLLVVVCGTLEPTSRQLDLGVGAAVGALAPLLFERSLALAPAVGFSVAVLAMATVVRALERLLARARGEADLDPLTGALNRTAFGRLANGRLQAARAGSRWGMIMVDLDDFGALNKRRGHIAGDAVLVEATACLRELVCPDGLVGRIGGDEFAAVVPAAQAESIARQLGRGLLARSEPISASIGVAATDYQETDWIALLREADISLRAAKREGKGQAIVFAENVERETVEGRRLLAEMIKGERIEMAVQPIVDLRSGAILAYEALARFDDAAGRGPAHWFTLADSLGMRIELELACLERAVALLNDLDEGVLLTVNVSAQAVHDPRIRRLLLQSRPQSLIVELTEEGLVRDLGVLRDALEPLRSRGVKLAVDDMGAGYSNLRQVTALGPSLVKLDRTLVHGIDSSPAQFALIDALIGYAQRTGAQIVAEGIETEAEMEVLRALGVPYGQGYLLAVPAAPWPEVHLDPTETASASGLPHGSWPVTIDASITSDEVRRRFAVLPELESLVIVDDERRPLGLIPRHRLLTMLGHRFGYALWGDKSIMCIADRDFLCLPDDTPIDEVARRSLARPLDSRHDPVLLVNEDGMLTSQVTIGDMLFAGRLERRG
ncbi:MAG TPA: EAL domain-containing protein, partial [Solirubrobacteraceae bacterium]|nr:EAL domain-containing protein [Solirubrobacteraceae bacterium]